jgi:Domain of unknown function (DUF5671)
MYMENNTAKNFTLQLGSLISLYLSLAFLLVLLFGIINVSFPDAAEGYWAIESATSSIRLGIAMVVVFFPTYIFLTRLVNQNRRQVNSGVYLGLTKWLIYLSLLIGGIVLLGDLVAVVMAFLEGELTERFLLKALAVIVIVGAAFYYYLEDAKGYWLKEEKKSLWFAVVMGLLVVIATVYGLTKIETPNAVRELKLDTQQISDLQEIQYRIENHYMLEAALPGTLLDLNVSSPLPEAPEERDPYTYVITESGFNLCANFAKESQEDMFITTLALDNNAVIKNRDDWRHGAGKYCFERIVQQTSNELEVAI